MKRLPLPMTDAEGFFGIRFESIGGLGAQLAGQILAEAGVLGMGYNGSAFSSYGSEKKGTPVRAYIRFGHPEREVRTSSPVECPHLVAVFHEALIATEKVAAGLHPHGTIIVNSSLSPQAMRGQLGLDFGAVGTVDATAIAVEEGSRVNTAMLGATVRALGFLAPAAVEETIRRTFQRRYPHLVEANLRTFRRGYQKLRLSPAPTSDAASNSPTRPGPAYGYLNAPLGGLILNPGHTVLKNLTASRSGFIPHFEVQKCVHCGLCDLVCPDFCLVWKREDSFIRLRGIDYRYCKGCMKCVDVCPTEALVEIREEPGYAEKHTVPLFPHLEAFKAPPGGFSTC